MNEEDAFSAAMLEELGKKKKREKVIKWKEMIKKRNYLKLKRKNKLI